MSNLGRAAQVRRYYHHVVNGGKLTPDNVARMVETIEKLERDLEDARNSQPEVEKADMVTIPEGNPDLNLAAWMDIRRTQIGRWADYLIREVGNLESEIARMRTASDAATPTAQEAVAWAYYWPDGGLMDVLTTAVLPYETLRQVPLYAHPPQPIETVTLEDAIAAIMALPLLPSVLSVGFVSRKDVIAALRDLKGVEANG